MYTYVHHLLTYGWLKQVAVHNIGLCSSWK